MSGRGGVDCPVCSKSYGTKRSMLIHMGHMHPTVEKPYTVELHKCILCHVQFREQSDLSAHWSDCPNKVPSSSSSSTLPAEQRVYPMATEDAPLLPPGCVRVDKVILDDQERLEYEFILWCRHHAIRRNPYHPDHATSSNQPWVFRRDRMDIMSIVDFALTNNLSNTGVEEMVRLFKTMNEGKSLRITNLPQTWRYMSSVMLEGVDMSKSLKKYSFPVPANLGFSFEEVPYVLKTYDCILEEILFNIETMRQGAFYFGEQSPPPGGECVR